MKARTVYGLACLACSTALLIAGAREASSAVIAQRLTAVLFLFFMCIAIADMFVELLKK
jgi:hypothetical protein